MGLFDFFKGHNESINKQQTKSENEISHPGEVANSSKGTAEELDAMRVQNQAGPSQPVKEPAPERIPTMADINKKHEVDRAMAEQAQKDRLAVQEADSGEMKVVKPDNRYAGRAAVTETPTVSTGSTVEVKTTMKTPENTPVPASEQPVETPLADKQAPPSDEHKAA